MVRGVTGVPDISSTFASQQGAFDGKAGLGPATGKTSGSRLMRAKLLALCAGLNPSRSPQKAAPSGVSLAPLGSVIAVA